MVMNWCGKAGLVALVFLGGMARAEDRALVIGNENYADAADITAADAALDAASTLERQGFRVISGEDLAADDARRLLSEQLAALRPEDRLVILLSGHFARSAGQSWFIGTDASQPDLASVDATGLNLATLMEIAATARGGAVLLLGTETRRLPLGPGLQAGLGRLQVPQGVTVISGDALAVATFATRQLPLKGKSLSAMLEEAPDLTAEGFLSPLVPFRPAGGVTPAPQPQPPVSGEDALWRATEAIGTVAAYESYLARYPQGRYAREARAEIAAIRPDPAQVAQQAEEALQLTRDQRRAIQRGLAMLGHDPRGVDGVFGPGSRGAITAWQTRNDLPATGFLNRDQLTRLSAQVDRRAAELEAEAEARRAEQERADRIYWDQTGAAGDEPGLRAYVKRYPDGLYADVANARLAVFDEAAREASAEQDRAAWIKARESNTLIAYRDYLRAFPRGAFAPEAQKRVDALTGQAQQDDAARKQAEAAEAALNLSGLARSLIEQRLDGLGFNPGPADGTFDAETRRAIRRFQAARNLPETGYMNQQTMVGLLAGGLLNLGD
ncbi:peptidoglycan-binding protein [Fertoebacter nigrum]|uniref:Peptidoglycan-binding protein n=1 Tax=Fertoeibacter niger TaxID=2656921 RepID=A0A8X8GV78_9RHOB|nr:peptidoglycan-binding protein [Fertoeibacter niger]NUB44949.1 peptidoglycan-binding protein [Fertoeibacter niger]